MQTAYNKLTEHISTEGKTPASIHKYNDAIAKIQSQIDSAKNEAKHVLDSSNPTVSQVNDALNKIKAVQPKITSANNLLENKADNSELVSAKNQLQRTLQTTVSTDGMTAQSTQNFNNKHQAAEQAIQNATNVINNGDATAQQITEAKNRVDQAEREYTEAKNNLRADKTQLENAYNHLNQSVNLTDKNHRQLKDMNEN